MICHTCRHYSHKYDYCVVIEYNCTGCSTAWATGKCSHYEKGEPSATVVYRENISDELIKEGAIR